MRITALAPVDARMRFCDSSEVLSNIVVIESSFEEERRLEPPQHHREGEVQYHDGHEACPDRAPGSQANADWTARGEIAVIAMDDRDSGAEANSFYRRVRQIGRR